MPHVVTVSSKRLLKLAQSLDYFAGDELEVVYRPGHGYYLSRNGAAFAWFRFEKVGVHWLNDLKATGRPNFANLRNGTAYQRGVFKDAPESVQNAKTPFKAGQRVVLRELRGGMAADGLRVGDTGTVREIEIGGKTCIGVEFDRITDQISGIHLRYASGVDSLFVNCCDALESVQNVESVGLRVLASPQPPHRQPRRDGRLIRWGMHKPANREWWVIRLYQIGERRTPGMTAKGVKWALEQEAVRA